ncbi:MAG: ribonuclease P protein component 1 [Candidatus Bathyarchaeota archaeon]|nr:ribonuclease P protein component 1 [Candidatus Bathyarchaeota archaeon]
MKVSPDVVRYEFIGTEAKIARSSQSSYVGVCGKVVDETKNTFTLLDKEKRRVIIKDSAVFHFKFPDGTIVEIDGGLLVGRPEDRLKKTIRRLW